MITKGARVLADLIDENRGKALAASLTSFGNQSRKIPTAILELMDEVFGITDENRGVYELDASTNLFPAGVTASEDWLEAGGRMDAMAGWLVEVYPRPEAAAHAVATARS
jgi:hypothetical protein